MSKHLRVAIRSTTAGVVIELTGDLDHHTAPEVRETLPGLRLQPGQQLTIDLGALTYCDSTGITVLLAARNHALAASATIALAAVPEIVSRVFRIVGLEQFFPTHPTTEAAEAGWHPTDT